MLRLALFASFGAALLAESLVAQPVALGGEVVVNTYTTGQQSGPAIAHIDDSAFVVVWQSEDPDGSGYGIARRAFLVDGSTLGAELLVNADTTQDQLAPRLVAEDGDRFLVVWESDGADGDGFGIQARRLSAVGTPSGAEIPVNITQTGNQRAPDIAVDGTLGEFVVVWQSDGIDGDGYGILAQRIDASGSLTGFEIPVNEYTTGAQSAPAVGRDAAGGFVVVWQSAYGDGSGTGIRARRFSADGTAEGSEVPVNAFTTGDQRAPRIARVADGEYIVAWESDGADGSGTGIRARSLVDGSASGSELAINTYTTGDQRRPSLVVDGGGRFTVAWDGAVPGDFGRALRARTFGPDGTPFGDEFAVNVATVGDQEHASVAALGDELFVVWQSDPADGSISGVLGRRFGPAVDLQHSATHSPDPVLAGASLTYDGSVSNGSPFDALETLVLLTLPGEVTIVGSTGCDPALSPGDLECRLGTLLGNGAVGYTIEVEVDSATLPGTIEATLLAASSTPEAFPGDESVVLSTTVGQEVDLGHLADDSIDPVDAGTTFDYLGTVTNAGPSNALATKVLLALPAAVSIVGSTGCDPALAPGDTECELGILAPGGAAGYGISVSVPSGTPAGTLAATLTATSSSPEGSPGDEVVLVTTAVEVAADLELGKTDLADPPAYLDPVVYELSVTNLGPSDAVGVQVTETIPPSTTLVATSGCDEDPVGVPVCSLGDLAVGATVTYTVEVALPADPPTEIVNQAVVSATTPDQNGANDEVSETTQVGRPTVAGSEFVVNSYTTGDQSAPSVAVDEAGQVLVIWQSNGPDTSLSSIQARRFDANGNALGDEVIVNTFTTGLQTAPSVAVNADGQAVVVWQSTGTDGSNQGIEAQRLDADGAPVGGELLVNTYTTGFQREPAVGIAADGRFVIVWQSLDQDGDGESIQAQRFAADGLPAGAEFQVNSYTTADQRLAVVATAPAGEFVVAWESEGQDGSGSAVIARLFDGAGAAVGGEFQVNVATLYDQGAPALAMDGGGGFVVAWAGDGQDGSGLGVFARRFSPTGSALGGEIRVNAGTALDQHSPSVARTEDGASIVVWQSQDEDGSGGGVFGQRFDAALAFEGGQFLVNSTTAGDQTAPAVALEAMGRVMVVWESDGQDGSGSAIVGQVLGDLLFADGFERGDTSAWSLTEP